MSKNTARKAWDVGFVKLGYRPVRDVIEEDQAVTRALREAAEERSAAAAVLASAMAERDLLVGEAQADARSRLAKVEADARARLDLAEQAHASRVAELNRRVEADGLDQAADEATLSKFSRKNVIAMHALIASSLTGAKQLAARLAALAQGDPDPVTGVPAHPLSVKQATELFRQLTRGVKDLNEATLKAIQVERLRVGDPTVVVGIKDDRAMTLDEADAAVQEAQALVSVARRREAQVAAALAAVTGVTN